ncbi:hypothetical protein [Flavobacterium granuli]|uniref:MnhB-related membrane protein n=1 Tax=Flavobacterium granuli TaxID=280093 RepID=A0ABU1RZD7_9FLAO|nr:hypothetical protein [Flavobacterium granuli]MDR6843335.1 putative MnhB-related membrane protein [Flavobacterium granuli]
MSKTIKLLLIVITILMLILSIKWFFEKREDEPLITILGEISALLVLIFENKINSVTTNKNKRTKINIDALEGSIIKANKNEDSEIKIKTSK